MQQSVNRENWKSFIDSGMLESYVAGNLPDSQCEIVELMAAEFSEIREEIVAISEAVEIYAKANVNTPGPVAKPLIMAMIDYGERIKHGEQPTFPPVLNEHSLISDFSLWLDRPDLVLPGDFKDIHLNIIGFADGITTAIVWIKDRAPAEVHETEYEKFLIVEGTCNISVGENVFPLIPGDYFSIPLHENHQVIVTSKIPCKVILQRMAA
ncbi:MAG: cupin domain-containing protein [Ferruginibacter sp.]